VCYVKYDEETSVGVALHLTNTVFIDRALIVIPVMEGKEVIRKRKIYPKNIQTYCQKFINIHEPSKISFLLDLVQYILFDHVQTYISSFVLIS